MSTLREAAQQALEAMQSFESGTGGIYAGEFAKEIADLRAALAEPDLHHCPQCGDPADNGHSRSIPPSPYLCTKCIAEPIQEPVACVCGSIDWCVTNKKCLRNNLGLGRFITTPPRKPLRPEHILDISEATEIGDYWHLRFARAIEAAHGIGIKDA